MSVVKFSLFSIQPYKYSNLSFAVARTRILFAKIAFFHIKCGCQNIFNFPVWHTSYTINIKHINIVHTHAQHANARYKKNEALTICTVYGSSNKICNEKHTNGDRSWAVSTLYFTMLRFTTDNFHARHVVHFIFSQLKKRLRIHRGRCYRVYSDVYTYLCTSYQIHSILDVRERRTKCATQDETIDCRRILNDEATTNDMLWYTFVLCYGNYFLN